VASLWQAVWEARGADAWLCRARMRELTRL